MRSSLLICYNNKNIRKRILIDVFAFRDLGQALHDTELCYSHPCNKSFNLFTSYIVERRRLYI